MLQEIVEQHFLIKCSSNSAARNIWQKHVHVERGCVCRDVHGGAGKGFTHFGVVNLALGLSGHLPSYTRSLQVR